MHLHGMWFQWGSGQGRAHVAFWLLLQRPQESSRRVCVPTLLPEPLCSLLSPLGRFVQVRLLRPGGVTPMLSGQDDQVTKMT